MENVVRRRQVLTGAVLAPRMRGSSKVPFV